MKKISAIVVLLSLCLATAPVAAAVAVQPLVTVSGSSPLAACQIGLNAGTSSGGTLDVNAEVEPYLAVNPIVTATGQLNMVGVWQQDRWSTGGAHGLASASSFDGGKTWTESALPVDACSVAGSGYTRASDPWVSIGPNGTAYVVSLGVSETATGVTAVTSTDGGKTWNNVHDLIKDPRSQAFNDKESVTADPTLPGLAYSVWDRFQRGQTAIPTVFAHTTDGGRSWSRARVITSTRIPHTQTVGNQIVVAPPTDRLFDFFAHVVDRPVLVTVCKTQNGHSTCTKVKRYPQNARQDFYISFIESSNGGKKWSKPMHIAKAVPAGVSAQFGGPFRTGVFLPEAAVDPSTGDLYVVWEDARFTNGKYPEIALIRSTDGGSHWSAPIRVNPPFGRPAFNPAVAVTPNGQIGVTYYDLRDLPTSQNRVPVEYWFVRSTDGGTHFVDETHIAGPFDMTLAPSSGGFFLGDYQGLASTGTGFQPFFVMTNNNIDNRTDVFTTTVQP
jgi:hypothetical protein